MTERTSADPGDEAVGTGPVQDAVLEVIGVVRAALDLVEDLVRHPPAVPGGQGLTDLATQLLQAAEPWLSPRHVPPETPPETPPATQPAAGPAPDATDTPDATDAGPVT